MPGPAKVCLRLAAGSIAADLAALERHRADVDLAELDADCLAPEELAAAGRLPALAGMPIVLAVRRRGDGGRWTGDERERAAVFRRLVGEPSGGAFAFVELEEDFAPVLPGVPVIRSLHDVHGVPDDLAERLLGLARGGAGLPKAVVAVRGSSDFLKLLQALARTRDVKKVIVGTGPAALAAGVLAARLGSAFCSADPAGRLPIRAPRIPRRSAIGTGSPP